MKEQKRIITVDDYDHRLLVGCIRTALNEYIDAGKPVEDVNELLLRVIDAPMRRAKGSPEREER